jgi:peptide deformylase
MAYQPLDPIPIVTVDSSEAHVLSTKTTEITKEEFDLAREIASRLYQALQPYFPAAGIAAPQIGIGKSIFLFSYDRNPEHLEAVINPTITPVGDATVEEWETCFSVFLSSSCWQCAKIARYEKIQVAYLNLQGEKIEKTLEGFAAKAFQHEFDHLQGWINIYRDEAEVKSFRSKEALLRFMQEVKKQDALRYHKPK